MWRFPIHTGLPGFDLTTCARRFKKKNQVSLTSLCDSNFGAFGGPWHGLPSGHYVGPHGCSSTRIVTK